MEKHDISSVLELPLILTITKLATVRIIDFASDKLNVLLKILVHAVVQLVEALRYKPEGRGFDFRLSY